MSIPSPSPNNPSPNKPEPRLLTIGGSDSGGAAGIQADLKTFEALGAYGMSALSIITAQNTLGVHGASLLRPEFLKQQITVVSTDIGIDALKTGFLATKDLIKVTAETIASIDCVKIIDPVIVNSKAEQIVADEGIEVYKSQLFNQATVITPNIREASLLTKRSITTLKDVEESAKELLNYGSQAVLIKGGYLEAQKAADYLLTKENSLWLYGTAIDTINTHGSGDTLSSALAVYLAKGLNLTEAFKASKDFLQSAIAAGASRQLGAGQGGLKQNFKHSQ